MIKFRLRCVGTAPLLMHSARLSDPLDPAAKALKKVTGKRTKTDDDHQEIARLEHIGSLYLDPDVGPYLPAQNLERCLVDAARTSKQGVKVQRGVFISTDTNPLAYKGPRDAEGLWNDVAFRHRASVKVGTARTMRCRPIFHQWTVEADGVMDPAIIDPADLQGIVETAGMIIGVGDWRPRFGRFEGSLEVLA